MRKSHVLRILLVASLAIGSAIVSNAQNKPTTATYFVCPTVSTNNGNGMWVIGYHGGYYVLVPKKGGVNGGSKVFLTVPVKVFSLAQIPAGWGLYSSLPSYPNFVGTGMLLQEGIDRWLGDPGGWAEGDMAVVSSNGDGTYTVTDLTCTSPTRACLTQQVTIDSPIPLASGAIW
jgi:hypothetical protein